VREPSRTVRILDVRVFGSIRASGLIRGDAVRFSVFLHFIRIAAGDRPFIDDVPSTCLKVTRETQRRILPKHKPMPPVVHSSGMFWLFGRQSKVLERGEAARRLHSAWLTRALADGAPLPRIPIRRVDRGGFSSLRATAYGARVTEAWWDIVLGQVAAGGSIPGRPCGSSDQAGRTSVTEGTPP